SASAWPPAAESRSPRSAPRVVEVGFGSCATERCGRNGIEMLRGVVQIDRVAIGEGAVRGVPVLLEEQLVVRRYAGDRLDLHGGQAVEVGLELLAVNEEVVVGGLMFVHGGVPRVRREPRTWSLKS